MKFPRFSLRTLFVLITLISIPLTWVAYELHIIRERKALLQHDWYFGAANPGCIPRPHSDLPFYRKWLGDTEIGRIDAWNEADADKAVMLFPELRELFFVQDRLNLNYDRRDCVDYPPNIDTLVQKYPKWPTKK